MVTLAEQLDALARRVADLEVGAADAWEQIALPVAVAINALNGGDDVVASEHDHPAVLARQLDRARRRRRVLAAAC